MKEPGDSLAELRAMLDDLRQAVDEEYERVEAGEKPGLSMRSKLLRYYVADIDARAKRLDKLGGIGTAGTQLFIPTPENAESWELGSNSRKERMGNLRRSLPTIWEDAAFSYLDGRYSAAVFGFAASLEAILKHELERHEVKYSDSAPLGRCIERAMGDVLPEESEVVNKAWEVKNIRNDVIHFNIERGIPESELARSGDVDRIEPVDPSSYVTEDGWITGDGETVAFGPQGATRIEEYRNAAETVMQHVREIRDHLFDVERQ